MRHCDNVKLKNCKVDKPKMGSIIHFAVFQFKIVSVNGRTFSHMYGSTFCFVPLLPHVRFHFLSLNCLYLFSHMYSSIQICIPLSWPLLGSANTVQCQVWVKLRLGQIWFRFGLGLGQVWVRFGLGLGQVWVRFALGWVRLG